MEQVKKNESMKITTTICRNDNYLLPFWKKQWRSFEIPFE